MLKSFFVSGENLLEILLVVFSDDSIAVIKKYGSIAGTINDSHKFMPSNVSEEKPLPNDKISEIAIKNKKNANPKNVFIFLTIIYCIMT